ncbi:L-asparaginase [Crepidotus variabilis]|uniref:L-asparaginase n=1 Tax=Crepidotus variabilis TaxID=179855 RepID=A0A9P6EHR6_9AGAR|nr:L-asparaginase [Crepidotus variabilis]
MANISEKNLIPIDKRALSTKPFTLVVHGGAGTMSKDGSTPEQRAKYRAGLSAALLAGHLVLKDGGTAMDAAVAAVTVLEDNPLFNAGKGAVFNVAGKNELEASIMVSKPPASHPAIPDTRRGLGLTLLTQTKNPSHLARALYLNPTSVPHTFISGETAEFLGQALGEELVDPSYFYTEHRWREHRRGLGLPEEPLPQTLDATPLKSSDTPLDSYPTGTVGAVALDVHGCISSVTSTGGTTNKLVGRIGDTPLMGGGYWAEEWNVPPSKSVLKRLWRRCVGSKDTSRAVGVSGTGTGDYFIRQATAVTIVHRVQFKKESLKTAAEGTVKDLAKLGGSGGVIALDKKGNVSLPLNSSGMYRGVIKKDGIPKTAIFAEDELS